MFRYSFLVFGGKRVFILGGHITPFVGKGSPLFIDKKHPDFGKKENKTLEELLAESINGAVENAGFGVDGLAAVVDKIVVGNFLGELFSSQGHLGPAAVGSIRNSSAFMNKPAVRVEGACASGGLAVQAAWDALLAGTSQVALVAGVEVQTTVSARVGGDYLARASHYRRQRGLDDFTFPCIFAKRMKAIQEAGHFTMEDIAHVVVKAYANGNKNPLAHMHARKVTLEFCTNASDKNPNFLGNDTYKAFLRNTDCSQVSDGAAAMLLANEQGLRKLNISSNDSRLVEIKSLVSASGNLYEDSVDPTRMQTSRAAAQQALALASVRPSDLHVAEVHDCFSLVELLMYEALGIADYGKAKDLIRNGDTMLEGRIPVNTGGGLLSFGHPVGATGVKQFLEVYRQMKGLCGDYQLNRIPEIGATLNMGGDDKTAVSSIIMNI